ncbi:hypothetical protein MAA8898_04237 [Maliponia aquimaris]|uniref:Uncharacterized protein n=1 Tax=Maliponia aquimaris TaxID=1673631 RepID=A0A238L367_9RHOB|nr:hypothetical protein MAA8898_04237 [Maliponia aquimaris]
MSKSSDIIGPDDSRHSVDLEGLPKGALKAIISKLNERSQKVGKNFRGIYSIKVSDLRELVEKVVEEFHSCVILSQTASVTIHFSNNQRYDFRNWREFEEFDSSQKFWTHSVSIEIILDVIRVEQELPERYEVEISVFNIMKEIAISFGPIRISSGEIDVSPTVSMQANVKYINYVLGKNIMSTIEDWEGALEKEESSFRKTVSRLSNRFPHIGKTVGSVAGLVFAFRLGDSFSAFFPAFSEAGTYLFFYGVSFVIFSALGNELGRRVSRSLESHKSPLNFVFTRGDSIRNESVRRKNRITVRKALIYVSLIALELIVAGVSYELWGAARALFN